MASRVIELPGGPVPHPPLVVSYMTPTRDWDWEFVNLPGAIEHWLYGVHGDHLNPVLDEKPIREVRDCSCIGQGHIDHGHGGTGLGSLVRATSGS